MKVTVVYHANKGDSKVVEWGAFTFFDGVPIEIEDSEANAHMLGKMVNNRCFEIVGMGGPHPQEPEVYPEETPDDDPESEQEDEVEEGGPQPEEKSSFEDYVPVKEKTAKASANSDTKLDTKPDKPRAKPAKRGR